MPAMTREEIQTRIEELQRLLDSQKTDPLQSYSASLAISAPLLRELSALHEKLRRLDGKR
jgi:hypothetical protein